MRKQRTSIRAMAIRALASLIALASLVAALGGGSIAQAATTPDSLSASWSVADGDAPILKVDADGVLQVTPADVASSTNDYSGRPDENTDAFTVSMSVNYTANADRAAGDMRIDIPSQLFGSQGSFTPGIPVGQVNPQGFTVRKDANGQYYVTNAAAVAKGTKLVFGLSWNYKVADVFAFGRSASDTLPISLSVAGAPMASASLKAALNVSIAGLHVTKKVTDKVPPTSDWNPDWGAKPSGLPANPLYVIYQYRTWADRSNGVSGPVTYSEQPGSGGVTAAWLGGDLRQAPGSKGSTFTPSWPLDRFNEGNADQGANGIRSTYVVVAYPKPADDGAVHNLDNVIKAQLKAGDGTTLNAQGAASYPYQGVAWSAPAGDEFALNKTTESYWSLGSVIETYQGSANSLMDGKPSLTLFQLTGKAQLYRHTLGAGADPAVQSSYGKRAYTATFTDDMLYLDGSTALLGDDDYNFTKLAAINDVEVDDWVQSGGQWTARPKASTDYQVQVRFKGASGYVPAADLTNSAWNESDDYNPSYGAIAMRKDYGLGVSLAQPKLYSGNAGVLTLPANVVGVRIVVTTSGYQATLGANGVFPQVALNPTAKVKAAVQSWGLYLDNLGTLTAIDADKHLVGFTGTNTGVPGSIIDAVNAKDKAQYDSSNLYHAPAKALLSMQLPIGQSNKTGNFWDDTVHGRFSGNYTIHSWEYADYGLHPQKSGVFYDLLPPGFVFNQSQSYCRSPDNQGTSSFALTPDYQHSGRTLLTITCHANTPVLYSTTGFDAIVIGSYSYQAVQDYGANPVNVAVYHASTPDWTSGRLQSALSYSGVSDAVNAAMKTLPGDTGKANWRGMQTTTALTGPTAAVYGLSKSVAGPDGAYDATATTGIGGDYSYQLRAANEPGSSTTGNILYDSLESAKGPNGETGWKGVLQSVDVTQIATLGARPVVWYATSSVDVSTSAGRDLTKNGWTSTPPSDLSTVKAVAVDFRNRPDGTSYTLPEKTGAVAILDMKAPNGAASQAIVNAKSRAYNTLVSLSDLKNSSGQHNGEVANTSTTQIGIDSRDTALVALKASKTLKGKTLTANAFGFTLTPASGSPAFSAPSPKNAADGTVDFGTLTLTGTADAGKTYTYTARESIPSGTTTVDGRPCDASGVCYDPTTYTVTIAVGQPDGTHALPYTMTVLKDGAGANGPIAFANVYMPLMNKLGQTGGDGARRIVLPAVLVSLLTIGLIGALIALERRKEALL